jgi:hypothetical protein
METQESELVSKYVIPNECKGYTLRINERFIIIPFNAFYLEVRVIPDYEKDFEESNQPSTGLYEINFFSKKSKEIKLMERSQYFHGELSDKIDNILKQNKFIKVDGFY